MDKYISLLAILAICVVKTSSLPQVEEIPEYPDYAIDCEWKEWGDCSGECGEGTQVMALIFYWLINKLQMFSAGLQAPYRDFGVQGYQNCRGYV